MVRPDANKEALLRPKVDWWREIVLRCGAKIRGGGRMRGLIGRQSRTSHGAPISQGSGGAALGCPNPKGKNTRPPHLLPSSLSPLKSPSTTRLRKPLVYSLFFRLPLPVCFDVFSFSITRPQVSPSLEPVYLLLLLRRQCHSPLIQFNPLSLFAKAFPCFHPYYTTMKGTVIASTLALASSAIASSIPAQVEKRQSNSKTPSVSVKGNGNSCPT